MCQRLLPVDYTLWEAGVKNVSPRVRKNLLFAFHALYPQYPYVAELMSLLPIFEAVYKHVLHDPPHLP